MKIDRVVTFSVKAEDRELINEAKEVAAKEHISFSYIMVEALKAYMEEHHGRTDN